MATDPLDMDELAWRFRGAQGEWYERFSVSQDLPQLATDALVADWDTPTLRALAGESADAPSQDLGEMFARVLAELDWPAPTSGAARQAFIEYLAWLILTERVSPLDGASRLGRIHYWEHPESQALAYFAGLVDEWEGG